MTDDIQDNRCNFLQGQPTNITVEQKFRLLLRRLRKDFPPDYPVKVRRKEINASGEELVHGISWLANEDKTKEYRYYVILIRKQDIWEMQADTLIHEWAHCLSYGNEHGKIFEAKYGMLYRALIEK